MSQSYQQSSGEQLRGEDLADRPPSFAGNNTTREVADQVGLAERRAQILASSDERLDDLNESAAKLYDEFHEKELTVALDRERMRREVRRRIDREERGGIVIPDPVGLHDLLAQPDDPVQWRIFGLWPANCRIISSGPRKAGKTVANGNIIRKFADGGLFLDCFPVTDVPGTIVLIDNEMNTSMLRRWYRDMGIKHPERVHVWALRGQGATFDILDEDVRREWARRLRALPGGTSALMLDCLAPALGALGLTESNEDVNRFLVAFDALLHESGTSDAMITHHMGHVEDQSRERSRGASRLRDWPDVEWRYIRDRDSTGQEIDGGARFLTAYGRDVDVAESRLDYDPATRLLSLAGGSRSDHRTDQHLSVVEQIVGDHPGINTTDLKAKLSAEVNVNRAAMLVAIVQRAVAKSLVHWVPAIKGNGRLYYVGPLL